MKTIYLTIDDCPSEDFKNKIDYLHSKSIPAILFCIGNLMEMRSDEITYAIKKGFIVGNHSYSHPNFSKISILQAETEISKTDAIIERLYYESGTKRPAKIFRFPHGDRGNENTTEELQNILRKFGYLQPMFDGISYKWDNKLNLEKNLDVYWTYDSKDYTLMRYRKLGDKSPYGFSDPKMILARMDEDSPEKGLGLNFQGSNEIVLIHDHENTPDLFITITEKLMTKNIKFQMPKFE